MSIAYLAYDLEISDMRVDDRITAQEALSLAHSFYTRIFYLRHGDEPVLTTDGDADDCIKHYIGRQEFIGWILLREEDEDLNGSIVDLADELFHDHDCEDDCDKYQILDACRDSVLDAAQDDAFEATKYQSVMGDKCDLRIDQGYLPSGVLWITATIDYDENIGTIQVGLNDSQGTELIDTLGSELCGDIWEAILVNQFD